MAKRKQPSELKVTLTFTPVMDWDNRLKRVMALLLRSANSNESRLEEDATTQDKWIEGKSNAQR